MFVPVRIEVGGTGGQATIYNRGFKLTGEKLRAFERASGDMSTPLRSVGEMIQAMIAGRFRFEGPGWQELSPAYREWKLGHVPGTPKLIGIRPSSERGTRKKPNRHQTYEVSGAMKRNLLDPAMMHVSPTRLLYAPTDPKAGYHQDGTDKMPARPLIVMTPTDLRVVDRIFVAWVNGLVEASGL